jgi:hypothetical protein
VIVLAALTLAASFGSPPAAVSAHRVPPVIQEDVPIAPTPDPCIPPPPGQYCDLLLALPSEEPADDGPDVLLLSLLTIGTAGGAAVLALIGYVVRNRVGFWLHRPPEREDGDGGSHH